MQKEPKKYLSSVCGIFCGDRKTEGSLVSGCCGAYIENVVSIKGQPHPLGIIILTSTHIEDIIKLCRRKKL